MTLLFLLIYLFTWFAIYAVLWFSLKFLANVRVEIQEVTPLKFNKIAFTLQKHQSGALVVTTGVIIVLSSTIKTTGFNTSRANVGYVEILKISSYFRFVTLYTQARFTFVHNM